MDNLLKEILDKKIISIIRGVPSKYILQVAEALYRGGITFMEVTYRPGDKSASRDTLKSIDIIKRNFVGKIHIGAGTVLSAEQVELAYDAGAEYIISPNVNKSVISRTKELGMISIPGALTPTEIITAWDMGADIVKIFPARAMGSGYFKDIKSSFNHVTLSAVGGVNVKNISEYLAAGADVLSIGSSLVNQEYIINHAWEDITKTAAACVEEIQKNSLRP